MRLTKLKYPVSVLSMFFAFVMLSAFTIQKTTQQPATSAGVISVKSLNLAKSTVVWIGKKITGQHTGTVNISSGTITTKNGILGGGEFTIDMNSLKCTDIQDSGYNAKLINHLKSEDFFNIAQYPVATLKITKVLKIKNKSNAYNLTGNLSIKGITKAISFPATFKKAGNAYEAVATISVDRTKWDIKYGSANFFEGLGDKAIKNEFVLNVNIVTN
ncbi:MAG TPA: YceI family protein [Chitinophagales bacterium]|nr:YceI family protein [Chitinophagales bacterium]HNL84090.1 YceI family protein [Chitinophagales bacterium]